MTQSVPTDVNKKNKSNGTTEPKPGATAAVAPVSEKKFTKEELVAMAATLKAAQDSGAIDDETRKALRGSLRVQTESPAEKLKVAYYTACATAWETWQDARDKAELKREPANENPHRKLLNGERKRSAATAREPITADQKKAVLKAVAAGKGPHTAKSLNEALGEGWNQALVVDAAKLLVADGKLTEKPIAGAVGMYSKEYSVIKTEK